jgi:hypothetical protein
MSTNFNSSYDDTNPFTDISPSVALAANTPLSYTVPGDNTQRYRADFRYNATSNVFVANNSTAASPGAGTVSASSRSSYKPARRYVQGGDVLSFVTPDTTAIFGFDLLLLPN